MTLPPLFSCHFPTYVKDCSNHEIDVLWYHSDFTQSRYPPGQEISEACTLICLLVAVRISREHLLIHDIENCSKLNIIVAEAMIEGNAIHAWLIKERLISHPYLSTEEALKYGGKSLNELKEWKFNVFHEEIGISLYKNINTFLYEWYKTPKSHTLFMLLITCGRTILFIFQEITYKVMLFDSHSHITASNSNRGLVIAQTTIDRLESLCNWYTEKVLKNCYNTQANKYELAFLYSYNAECSNNHRALCECQQFCKI
ncbi:uncharacterized protein LOC126849237 isoform X1 [Cataglyphis hispanica]|uniref:uncharacterized protein LOC126849237 isoform X1 n=1 Tax=Cataglyphis hispanica TaxID=1086592 RepID=UPI00218001A5|nr:uncharacterized protein LOC126849237 isoform X1 [Cataglyphis hispanica]